MDAVEGIIVFVAVLAVIAVWRLVAAIRRAWDGDIEDLFEDVVVRRLVMACATIVILVVAVPMRGSMRSLLGIVLD